MSVLLSSVVVGMMAFAPAEPPDDLTPRLTLRSPTSTTLPANATLTFDGVAPGGEDIIVFVNWRETPHPVMLLAEQPNTPDDVYVLRPTVALAPGDELMLRSTMLDEDLMFDVVDDDDTPPTFAGDGQLSLDTEGFTNCSPTSGVPCGATVLVSTTNVTDEGGVSHALVVDDDSGETLAVLPGSAGAFIHEGRGDRRLCVRVVAVDLAGNASSSDVGCIDIVDDAGGCTSVGASGDALLGLALPLVVLRRRCRRRRFG